MRSRLFAVFILILLVGVPLILYWYFFDKQVASISISVNIETPFTVELHGTLSSSYLPLADKLLVYKQDCFGTCSFSPVPPVQYDMTLTSSGKVPIHDTIALKTGETKTLSYVLQGDIQIHEYTGQQPLDDGLAASLVENANSTMSGTFSLVGTDDKKVYAIRHEKDSYQIGLLFPEKFISLRHLPEGASTASLDITRKFFRIPLINQKTLILSTNMEREAELSLSPDVVVPLSEMLKISTHSGVFLYDGEALVENPRFTDFLDIDPKQRLGYIAATDARRLSLSNFPSGESVLVMLDRTTGKSYVVQKGINIRALYFDGETPVYIDNSGKVWQIILNK